MVLERIKRAQKLLKKEKLAALLIEKPVDLFYLTGKKVSLGKLLIGPRQVNFFLDSRYLEMCQNIPGVKSVPRSNFERLFKSVKGPIGFNSEETSFASYEEYRKMMSKRALVPLDEPIRWLRAVKEKGEIEKLKRAAHLNGMGMEYIRKRLKLGISEKEISRLLILYWYKLGGEEVAFEPIIAFGENSAIPHHRPTSRRLKRGDTVLIDIGIKCEAYVSDLTRTFFFGPPSKKMREIYAIVEEARDSALQIVRPGTRVSDVDFAARDLIERAGYGDFFKHSLGHGIGLEIHEFPSIRKNLLEGNVPLEEGMAITIEPGIYLPGIGGVRIENSLIVTKTGYKLLNK